MALTGTYETAYCPTSPRQQANIWPGSFCSDVWPVSRRAALDIDCGFLTLQDSMEMNCSLDRERAPPRDSPTCAISSRGPHPSKNLTLSRQNYATCSTWLTGFLARTWWSGLHAELHPSRIPDLKFFFHYPFDSQSSLVLMHLVLPLPFPANVYISTLVPELFCQGLPLSESSFYIECQELCPPQHPIWPYIPVGEGAHSTFFSLQKLLTCDGR